MAKSQDTYSKKEKEKKRLKKRQEKEEKKKDKKSNPKASGDDMIAYVDEFGTITSTPPDGIRKQVKQEDIMIGIPRQSEMEPEDPIKKGKVSFFNESKGYGFIKETETQESYFVHINGLIDSVGENDKVTFELENGPKGPMAVRVKKAV